jgi:hypothetical protein
MTPALQFRPHQGLMKLGERLASRAGLGHLWGGDEGIGSILSEVLKDAGVPVDPIPLTPRVAAQAVGIVKRKRTRRAK